MTHILILQGHPDSVDRAHGIRALERNVLGFVGFSPVRETLIGSVESLDENEASKWFTRLEKLAMKAG